MDDAVIGGQTLVVANELAAVGGDGELRLKLTGAVMSPR
jgi:hypothetical protein